MRAYVDTNILVDLVLSRQEFLPDAQRVFAIGYAGEAQLELTRCLTLCEAKLMDEYGLISERDDLYDILNLGAILFAKQLKDFPTLRGKEIIVRRYQGTNNRILSLDETPCL